MVPFIGLLSFAAFIIGIIATIKGSIHSLGIKNRKVGAVVMIISFILFVTMIGVDDSPAPEKEQSVAIEEVADTSVADIEQDIKEPLEFKGTMELKVNGDNVIMSIASNVTDGGIFEVTLISGNFDVLSDFVEIIGGKIEKAFKIPEEWDTGYVSGMAMFRFNLDDHPQPDHIKEIYGEKGEKMLGEQIAKTTTGGFNGNIEPVTIAYPDEATVQKRIDELFISSLQEMIKSSNGVIYKIEPDGSWQIVLVTVSDDWYFSPEHEKERFAETIGGIIETLVKNAGKVNIDRSVNVYFYDMHGKELASPKFFGGYNIER